MKKILVPTDFSDVSEYGINTAIEMSEHLNAALYILYVINPADKYINNGKDYYVYKNPDRSSYQKTLEMMLKSEKRLQNIIARYRHHRLPIYQSVFVNNFRESIDMLFGKSGFDLIVMGTRAKNSIEQRLVGNSSENKVNIMDTPVLYVTDDIDELKLKNVALTLDIARKPDRGLRKICNILKYYDPKFHLLYILHSGININKPFEKLKKIAKSNKLSNYSLNVITNEKVENAIMALSKRNNADLAAIITHNNGFLSKTGLKLNKTDNKKNILPVLNYNFNAH